jgi:outer membrane immunogenic protein
MRLLLAAGIAFAFFATPVAAQQRQAQTTTTWSGAQIGGFGGTSTLGGSFSEPGAHFCAFGFSAICPEVPFSFSAGSRTTATGGAFIGYNVPWGIYIVGIEADIAAKSRGSSSTQGNTHPATGGFTTETFTGSLSQGWDASIRARFGLPINYSRTLIYATGGVAFGNVSGSFGYAATWAPSPTCVPTVPPTGCPSLASVTGGGAQSWSDTRTGYTVGAGVEWVSFRNVKLRIEYRYTDFGSFSKDVPLAITSGACGTPGCLPNGNAHMRSLLAQCGEKQIRR